MVREYTCKMIDYCEQNIIDWETLARACLSYMSEDDVEDMARCNDFVLEDEEEEE